MFLTVSLCVPDSVASCISYDTRLTLRMGFVFWYWCHGMFIKSNRACNMKINVRRPSMVLPMKCTYDLLLTNNNGIDLKFRLVHLRVTLSRLIGANNGCRATRGDFDW